MPVGGRPVDEAAAGIALDGRESTGPIAPLRPIGQHGLAGPRECSGPERFFGIGVGGFGIASSLCLDVQAAETQSAGLGKIEHLGEGRFRLVLVAGQLRGLGAEQQNHGFPLQELLRLDGMTLRRIAVACADRHHAARQGREATPPTPGPRRSGHERRDPEDEADQSPEEHHEDRHGDQQDRAHQGRARIFATAERHQDGPGMIGHPDRTKCCNNHDGEVDQHPYHQSPTFIFRSATRGRPPVSMSASIVLTRQADLGCLAPCAARPREVRASARSSGAGRSALGMTEGRDGACHKVSCRDLGIEPAPCRIGPGL